MEILLSFLLALAVVTCAWLWAGRKAALALERRLREEIGGVTRASLTPLATISSPDLRSLFPEPPPAAPVAPGPPLPEEIAGPIDAPRPPRPLPAGLVDEAERHRDALRALEGELSRMRPSDPGSSSPPASTFPQDQEIGPQGLSTSVSAVGTAVEPFLDQSTRLRNDLQAIGAQTSRVLASLDGALPLAREAAQQTEALSPFVASLSGLADRLNLLSLDGALSSEGPAGEASAPRLVASLEIRALVDETRTFSRDLGARVRKATEAARRSEEAFSAARDVAGGARDRGVAASEQGDRLSTISRRLEESVEALRAAADGARLEWEKLVRMSSALEHRLGAERRVTERWSREAALNAEAAGTAREVVREERRAAEELAERLRSGPPGDPAAR